MRRALPITVAALLAALAPSCDEPTAAVREASTEPPAPDAPRLEPVAPLGVGPAPIARARREVFGLAPIPESLLTEELARRRATPGPSYAALRAGAEAMAGRPLSQRGRIALSRPAGEGLWIVALMTRADGARWVDPVYVLSVVEPPAVDADAWVDGFVVGERTIGQHALPLLVAYSIEAIALSSESRPD